MTLLAHLVARNEADRYLDAALAALPTELVHVYDDRSTDATVEVARQHGAVVGTRAADEPSFMEHEGQFRQAAWQSFESCLLPQVGDWVLAVDCDEFLVASGDLCLALAAAIEVARDIGAVGVDLPIPEIWDFCEGQAWQRLDGYWAMLSAPRLFAYQPGGRFVDQAMACGSVPTYVREGFVSQDTCGLAIAHLGYLDPADRVIKYERYSGVPGHSSTHVKSIRQSAQLGVVDWQMPAVWRGTR